MAGQIEPTSPPLANPKAGDPHWAWAVYEPSPQQPWTLAWAGHLFRRAGFGATWPQLQQALALGPQATVSRLLRPEADYAAFNRAQDEYENAEGESGSAEALRSWWLRRMILTPHPLLEKMTLFWHNHFAVSNEGGQSTRLMRQYLQRLRHQALGSLPQMFREFALDPALLLWLGAAANRKAMPNQHWGRTFLEAYATGPGEFGEKDAAGVARAYTGWFVIQGQLRFVERERTPEPIELFGQQGIFTVAQVADLVWAHPAIARRIVRKVYRWLISETTEPAESLLIPLADALRKSGDILPLVETMLRSNLFFSSTAYRQRIKCPVEFGIGMITALEGIVPTTPLGQDLAGAGQNLYHPPTPKGWAGGEYWINPVAMAARLNLTGALLQNGGRYAGGLRPGAIATRHQSADPAAITRFLFNLHLQDDLEPAARDAILKTTAGLGNSVGDDPETVARRLVNVVAALPEFHLA